MSKERAVLAVDVGGSHVKVLVSGETESRRAVSGPTITAAEMVEGRARRRRGLAMGRRHGRVPAPVHAGRVVSEPVNLGKGWVGFDFEAAFGKPTKVMNDAAMQALGSYDGGTMLFLGLGTGLGTALIVDGIVEPMEIGHLPFKKRTYEDYVGERGLEALGKKRWRELVNEAVEQLTAALEPDYVVLGGGNATKLHELPPKTGSATTPTRSRAASGSGRPISNPLREQNEARLARVLDRPCRSRARRPRRRAAMCGRVGWFSPGCHRPAIPSNWKLRPVLAFLVAGRGLDCRPGARGRAARAGAASGAPVAHACGLHAVGYSTGNAGAIAA